MAKKNHTTEPVSEPRLKWFYLSFVDKKFLGAVVIEAVDTVDASRRAWAAGINPGGQMLCAEINPEQLATFPPELRNRLLSRDEVVNGLDGVRVGDMSEQSFARLKQVLRFL